MEKFYCHMHAVMQSHTKIYTKYIQDIYKIQIYVHKIQKTNKKFLQNTNYIYTRITYIQKANSDNDNSVRLWAQNL